MFKNLKIETRRLIIRNFLPTDYKSMHQVLNDINVLKFLNYKPMSIETVKNNISFLIKSYSENSQKKIVQQSMAVILKENNELIGWSGLGELEYDTSQTEIYYTISSDYWNLGYATEAASSMIDFAFSKVKLDKIIAVINPKNIASKHVIKNFLSIRVLKNIV